MASKLTGPYFFGFDDITVQGNIFTGDDNWIGLSATEARLEWDDQSTDEMNFLACKVGIGTQTPAVKLHAYELAADVYARIETDKTNGKAGLEFLNDAKGWTVGVNASDVFVVNDAVQFGGTNQLSINSTLASFGGDLYAPSFNSEAIYTDAPGYPSQGVLSINPTLNMTDDITQYFICSAVVPAIRITAAKTNSGYVIGNKVQAIRDSAADYGELTRMYGNFTQYGHNLTDAAAKTEYVYGIYLKPLREAGTIDWFYGLYIDTDGAGACSVFRQYGIYVANTSWNYFAGNVGIGAIEPGTMLQIKGADAYITLQNSTAENGEGGAETKIIFEDHTDVTLAQIQASHAGTADDTKGDLIFSTHSGAALVERMRLDDAGNVKIGGDSVIISDASGNLTSANGVASFGPAAPASITVVNGIVTAISS